MLEGRFWQKYSHSKKAASAYLLARYELNKEILWPRKFQKLSSYKFYELQPISIEIHEIFREALERKEKATTTKFLQYAIWNPKSIVKFRNILKLKRGKI